MRNLLKAATIVSVLAGLSACTPTHTLPQISNRDVPDPFARSGEDVSADSLVRSRWMCRTEVPDPLAGQEDGPKIRFEATLYGEDVIVAEVARECLDESRTSDTCQSAARERYRQLNNDLSRLRVRLDLQSTFSVNSLNARFWDVYLKDERDIGYEPVAVIHQTPVIVREDTLREPGRAPLRGGVYTRSIDLYFPRADPFGTQVLGPDTREIRLVISQNRRELTTFVWHVKRDGQNNRASNRRTERPPSGF